MVSKRLSNFVPDIFSLIEGVDLGGRRIIKKRQYLIYIYLKICYNIYRKYV